MRRFSILLFLPLLAACFAAEEEEVVMVEPEPIVIEDLDAALGQ